MCLVIFLMIHLYNDIPSQYNEACTNLRFGEQTLKVEGKVLLLIQDWLGWLTGLPFGSTDKSEPQGSFRVCMLG